MARDAGYLHPRSRADRYGLDYLVAVGRATIDVRFTGRHSGRRVRTHTRSMSMECDPYPGTRLGAGRTGSDKRRSDGADAAPTIADILAEFDITIQEVVFPDIIDWIEAP